MKLKKNIRIIDDECQKKQLISQCRQIVNKELVNELTDYHYAKNSLLAMTKDWNLYLEFCLSKRVSALPTSATALRQFIEHESRSRKYSTIKRYVVTISLFHRVLGLADPSATSAAKLALSKIRLDKHGDNKSTVPFESTHLMQLDTLLAASDQARDIRNLAIYHVMFNCLAKRGELRDLQLTHLTQHDTYYSVAIGDHSYELNEVACRSLQRWLDIRNTNSDWLFSSVDKHGNVNDQKLNDSSIYRIVRSASETLGLTNQFSGQSLRVGAAKDMARNGAKTKDIQYLGRWMSAAMPYYYLGNKAQANAERMLFKTFKPIS